MTKVIDNIPFAENAELRFSRADINIFKNFPQSHIELHDLIVTEKSDSENQSQILKAKHFSIDGSLSQWKDHTIIIQKFVLDSASINCIVDKNGSNNFLNLLSEKKPDPQNFNDSTKWNIDYSQLDISITNSDIEYYDSARTTNIKTYIKNLRIEPKQIKDSWVFDVNSEIEVDHLILNEDNGSFVEGANLKSDFIAKLDSDGVSVEPSELYVDDHLFLFDSYLSMIGKGADMHFINKATAYEEVVQYLTPKLRQTLEPYSISNTFYSDTRLEIRPNIPIRVDIDFSVGDNDVFINDEVFSHTTMSGKFSNRKYTHKIESDTLNSYIRFDLEQVISTYDEMQIELPTATISNNPNRKNWVEAEAKISGNGNKIGQLLENDKFYFSDGEFVLDAKVDASFKNLQSLITGSDIKMVLTDTEIKYLPSDVSFPLQTIEIEKLSDDGIFSIVGATIDREYDLELDGSINNLTGMLFDLKNSRAVSDITLNAKRMSWEDFINIFGGGDSDNSLVQKTEEEKRKSLKQTLTAIQYHFGPTIRINIDTSGYYDRLSIGNVEANLNYIDERTLNISDSRFEVSDGIIEVDCKLDIGSDLYTPFDLHLQAEHINLNKFLPSVDYFNIKEFKNLEHLPRDFDVDIKLEGLIHDATGVVPESLIGDITFSSTVQRVESARILFSYGQGIVSSSGKIVYPLQTKVELKGNPYVFNDFFKNDKFFFSEGKFTLDLDYTGVDIDLENIISDGDIRLTIDSSQVLYSPLDVVFPLTKIDLDIKNDSSSYNVLIRSDNLNQELNFAGEIVNISELIVGETGKPIETITNVYAPRITWDNFVDIFQIGNDKNEDTLIDIPNEPSVRKGIIDIFYSFKPQIDISIDTLEYSDDLALYNFKSDLNLLDSHYLEIKKLAFDYDNSSVDLEAEVYIFDNDIETADFRLETKNLNIRKVANDMKESFGFSMESFNGISGRIDMIADLKNVIPEKNKYFLDESTYGFVEMKVDSLRVTDADWLKNIGRKVYLKDRFEDVRFSRMENTFIINGDRIDIPLMELQSNAFNAFVEGHYDPDNPNIWLSVPLHNLKKKDLSLIPEKEGYNRRKLKLYLQYAKDKNGEKKSKLRLSKRKFFQNMQ